MHLHTNTTPDTIAHINGEEWLFFSGFSYLGLHTHPGYKAALHTGIDTYGAVFVSSRIANLRLEIYEELETALAALLQLPAAITYSSGYLASQAAIQYAATQGELCYAPGAHPSLWYNKPLIPAISWNDWAQQTIEKVNAWPDDTFVIVADGVNPLTSTINDFSWLSRIHRQVLVVIDDSHGFGILGPDGSGSINNLPRLPQLHYLITASLAKAYSTQGGVVAGEMAAITALRRMPLFTAGTPMMPASVWAFLKSFPLHARQRALSRERIAQFSDMVADIPQVHNPFQLPVFLLRESTGIEKRLHDQGIMISSFGYPDQDSPPINRIIITAQHQPAQLEILQQQLHAAYSSVKTS